MARPFKDLSQSPDSDTPPRQERPRQSLPRDKVDVTKTYQLSPFDASRDEKYRDNVAVQKSVVVKFELPKGKSFSRIEAKGSVPAYWHMKTGGINLHLRDGLAPGREIVGLVEVSVRKTKPEGRENFVSKEFFAINLYPADGPATHVLRIDSDGAGDTTVEVEEQTAFFMNKSGIIQIAPVGLTDKDDTLVPTGDEPPTAA